MALPTSAGDGKPPKPGRLSRLVPQRIQVFVGAVVFLAALLPGLVWSVVSRTR